VIVGHRAARAADEVGVLWVMGLLGVWSFLAFPVAVVVGRGIRLADRRASRAAVLTTADLPDVVPASRAAF
jgi:hypothetical protein